MTTTPPASKVNLAKVFQSVAGVMAENQTALNQADTTNHDHGTNMVQTFQTIAKAVQARKSSPVSTQLQHAATTLRTGSTSGSAQLYADGLQEAAARFKGRQVTEKNAMELIQSLMGLGGQASQAATPAPQPQAGGADMLGSLLGGLMGGGAPQQQTSGGDMLGSLLGGLMGGSAAPQQQQPAQAGGADLLGSLLGGLMGGGAAPQQQQSAPAGGGDMLSTLLGGMLSGAAAPQQQPTQAQSGGGLNLMNIMQLVMVYLQAKQSGQSPLAALAAALMNSGSPLANRDYRAQSSALVMQTLLQLLTPAAGQAK